MKDDLLGKVFLVTGGTDGIGKAAAHAFVQHGATVVLVARNAQKAQAVVDELRAAAGNPPPDRVRLLLGDLSIQADVRKVAQEFRAAFNRLDVLVNNAGGVFIEHRLTVDGLEQTFAINHLGYFLLTNLLLDLLRSTPGARVVSTSSGAYAAGTLNLDTVARRPGGGAGFPAYADSKLANILFTRALARRLQGSGVTANCFHPGVVRTGFGRNNKGWFSLGVKLGGLFMRSPEKGADTLVWLATSPDAASLNGAYVHDRKVARTFGRAQDDTLAANLWTLSEKLTGLST